MAPRKKPTVADAFDQIAKKTGQPRARVLEEWSERAAIRQYLGGMTRVEAELRALDDTTNAISPASLAAVGRVVQG